MLSLANGLLTLICGIGFLLSAVFASAEDSTDKVHIDAQSFRCITEMSHVRQFYVDNLLGNLDATLAVANSATGGIFAEVVNRFGENCFGCHIQARPQWDLVCEMDHGCAPIPLTRAMSGALQRTDPRCKTQTVSSEDAEALRQLNELLKPSGSNTKQN